MGINTADDAGVFQISDDLALIQTVDFFTPVLDDPYTFGQVAAANSLSDVYAMGGTPLTVLNIVGWPKGTFPLWVLTEILRGGQDKVTEAGAVVAGGHTCVDRELKYGLSVTGTIHPKKIYTNAGAKAGDKLILTKPLGMGVISTAIKLGRAGSDSAAKVGKIMATLNKKPSEIMQRFRVNSCTDVTGFGLLGHLDEMLKASGQSGRLHYLQIPILEEAFQFASGDTIPGGSKSNQKFLQPFVQLNPKLSPEQATLVFDAQTSGGLILSTHPQDADALLAELHSEGISEARLIGEVAAGEPGKYRWSLSRLRKLGADGDWRRSRASNPMAGFNKVRGEFDPHTFPQMTKKIRYSKGVNCLLWELSDKPIAYAEEEGPLIIHFSKDGEPVLLEILNAKDFLLNSLSSVVKEEEVALP